MLQQEDVDRNDCMNWESAQQLLFPKVRNYLQQIANGTIQPKENVSGTIAYLLMTWKYVRIVYSLEASLLTRIKYATYVVNVLRIWRLWVYRTGTLTLQSNFISRETYQGTVLSCHHVVLAIKAPRDFAPNHSICLERFGTDVCEE